GPPGGRHPRRLLARLRAPLLHHDARSDLPAVRRPRGRGRRRSLPVLTGMGRRVLTLALVVLPALALGVLGVVVVASATARQGAATFGTPAHFAVRQVAALAVAAALALVVARAGPERLLRAAPPIFVAALLGALAVFVPGVGVRAG